MSIELTWRKAIEKVLSETPEALHYTDIADKIIADRLRLDVGATPANTVAAIIATGIKKEGESCPFQKVGRGLFVWKGTTAGSKPTKTQDVAKVVLDTDEEDKEDQYDIVTSFGMFWKRGYIDWTSKPKVLGMQQIAAEPVDFHDQVGIYLLYDGREIIYVGRTTDRPLGRRLYEHTMDRLSSRWDRFSWFGLLPVSESGKLGKMPATYPSPKLIPALEAILIEALEPRQNRKRGDDLSAVEYIQKEDPEIQKKRAKQTLEAALNRL